MGSGYGRKADIDICMGLAVGIRHAPDVRAYCGCALPFLTSRLRFEPSKIRSRACVKIYMETDKMRSLG